MAVDITLIPSGHFSGGAHLALDTGDARDLRTVMNQLIATHNLTDAIATAGNVVQRDANADVILPATPTTSNAATPKAWVETQIAATASGLRPKGLVKAASTANLALTGEQTIDAVACVADDKVLAKNQTAPEENGLYVVAAGAWTRTANLAVGSDAAGAYLQVEQGTDNAEHFFVCTDASGSALVGTDGLTFEEWGKIVSHENLDDLAGGAAGDYYHFTAAQHTVLVGVLGVSHTVETTGAGVLTSAAKGTAYNLSFGATSADIAEIASSLAVSSIVETDASSKLTTASKATAYNKTFGAATGNVPSIAAAGLTASQIVETDGASALITAAKATAYNVNFGLTAGDVPAIAAAGLTVSEIVETDASGDLITATKGTAYNKAFGATTGDVPQIAAAGLTASQIVETDASSDLITAAKLTAYNKNFGAATGDVPGIAAAGLTASQNVQTDGSGDLVTAAITPYSFFTITVNPKDLAAAGTTTCEWQMPFAATLVEVSACAQTIVAGGDPVVDVQEGGVTCLSSTMDLGTAGAGVVVVDSSPSDTAIADNANMTVLLTQAGVGASEECTVVLTFKVPHTTA